MPRVYQKTKSNRGQTYTCGQCHKEIAAGETTHGHPKPSQLTQSKMSGVYAAIETAEEAIDGAENVDDIRTALDDCKGEVESVKDEYQSSLDAMPDQLQQGTTGQEIEEKIQALDDFMNELDGVWLEDWEENEPPIRLHDTSDADWAKEVADWMASQPQPEGNDQYTETEADFEKAKEAWETRRDEHLQAQRDTATDALGNLSI